MALVLSKNVDAYTQLQYSYNWSKEEKIYERKEKQRGTMDRLAGESGVGSGKRRR